jgi:hypothetical protein
MCVWYNRPPLYPHSVDQWTPCLLYKKTEELKCSSAYLQQPTIRSCPERYEWIHTHQPLFFKLLFNSILACAFSSSRQPSARTPLFCHRLWSSTSSKEHLQLVNFGRWRWPLVVSSGLFETVKPGTHYPHVTWARMMLRVQLGYLTLNSGAQSHFCQLCLRHVIWRGALVGSRASTPLKFLLSHTFREMW